MFTGIVAATGKVTGLEETGGDIRIHIRCDELRLSNSSVGDSICVSGVCLTMLNPGDHGFTADVSRETLELTTLADLAVENAVNLELAMSANDRFGGHLVTGHVDGKGKLLERHPDGRAERLSFSVPDDLARYIATKGSVCVDGVSLTVNDVHQDRFSVCLIPHTLEVTTLGRLQAGDEVNIEIDLLARYVERLRHFEQS